MKAAIVGFGRMGREIARVLADRGHIVCAVIDPVQPADSPAQVYPDTARAPLSECDVAIEFSSADAVLANTVEYARAGCAAVVGSTGWTNEIEPVRTTVEASDIGFVHGSNFSIGAHIFLAVGRYAASLVSQLPEYDLMIHEVHHRRKRDSPSGTALTLAAAVLDAVARKQRLETGRFDRAPKPEELHVSSSRVGSVPGMHSLVIDSDADTIEVRHQARNRTGFALGAVLAAEWISGRIGFFPVETFVKSLLHIDQGE